MRTTDNSIRQAPPICVSRCLPATFTNPPKRAKPRHAIEKRRTNPPRHNNPHGHNSTSSVQNKATCQNDSHPRRRYKTLRPATKFRFATGARAGFFTAAVHQTPQNAPECPIHSKRAAANRTRSSAPASVIHLPSAIRAPNPAKAPQPSAPAQIEPNSAFGTQDHLGQPPAPSEVLPCT